MATRRALLFLAAALVCSLTVAGGSLAALLWRPDMQTAAWLAGAGALLAVACGAGVVQALHRHFTALSRLRDGVVMLLTDTADRLPDVETGEVARLRAAVDTLMSRRLELQTAPDRRLAAVLGSIAEAIVVTTASGQVSLVNDAARALLGPERVAVGTSLFAALSRTAVDAAVAEARTAGRPIEAELYTVESETLSARVSDLGEHGGAVITFPLASLENHAAVEHDLTLHDVPPPPGPVTPETRLDELPAFVFDCETTGLDVRNDAIVALGGVRMHGPQIFRGETIDQLVDPGRPVPRRSTAIHGITDAMVADAGGFEAHWPELEALMRGTVLVGHNVAFDIAQLRAAAKRAGIDWTPPPSLDTLLLTAALEPAGPGFGLEAIAERFGVSIRGRHTALGDSLVTAEIYARLLPRLAERGVATLGEAVAFGRRATGFVKRQRQSGWYDPPD